jgi:hypothetical protein
MAILVLEDEKTEEKSIENLAARFPEFWWSADTARSASELYQVKHPCDALVNGAGIQPRLPP